MNDILREPTAAEIAQAKKEIDQREGAEEHKTICCCGNTIGDGYSCDGHTPVSQYDWVVYQRAKEIAERARS